MEVFFGGSLNLVKIKSTTVVTDCTLIQLLIFLLLLLLLDILDSILDTRSIDEPSGSKADTLQQKFCITLPFLLLLLLLIIIIIITVINSLTDEENVWLNKTNEKKII